MFVILFIMLFFGTKIPKTKHEIILHAMSLICPYPDSFGRTGSARYLSSFKVV